MKEERVSLLGGAAAFSLILLTLAALNAMVLAIKLLTIKERRQLNEHGK